MDWKKASLDDMIECRELDQRTYDLVNRLAEAVYALNLYGREGFEYAREQVLLKAKGTDESN